MTCRRHRRYQLVHRSFAAKDAAQDDKGSLEIETFRVFQMTNVHSSQT
jgi:hypothetical protein